METEAQSKSQAESLETATLGSGCFWCTEAVFLSLKGVQSVVSGYSGGKNPNQGYCQYVIRPKVEKFRKQFAAKLRDGTK